MREIPLNRGGEEHYSYDRVNLEDYRNEKIGELSQAVPVMLYSGAIEDSKEEGFSSLREIGERELLEKIQEAGEYFTSEVNGESFEDYCKGVTGLTGLPIKYVREAGKMVEKSMKEMDRIIEAQTPAEDLNIYDNFTTPKKNYAYTPKGRNLGVITPSNHPAVNALWLSAIGLKYPTLIRPSSKEPLTPKRLVDSLCAAGFPENSLYFLPGNREFGEILLSETDKGIVFGGPKLKEKYENIPDTKAFGPGNSKIFVDEEFLDKDIALQLAKDSMLRDGGRGCVNVSQIVTAKEGKRFAERLAEEIGEIEIVEPEEEEAEVPAMKCKKAQELNEHIERNLGDAEDLIYDSGDERLEERNGAAFIKPTVIYIGQATKTHPLFNEFPFQYTVVTNYSEGILDNTLTLTMLTNDERKIKDALLNPSIKKVHENTPTCDVDLREPHEGYLSDFLYEKK